MFLEFLLGIFWFTFSFVLVVYFSYYVILYYYNSRLVVEITHNQDYYPTVSLIVPVYNEETIISKKINNIEDLDYPAQKIEAIFVDGCSTDKTPELIGNYSKHSKIKIILIKESERSGYNSAICKGVQNSSANIIVLTDGGSYYDKESLKFLLQPLLNCDVGAVTGKEIVRNNHGGLGPELEAKYRKFYDFMRTAETRMDSTPDSKGEILAVRKEICEKLINKVNLSSSASFDCCVPYQAKLDGYRTIFEPKAEYYECAPSSFMDRMKQQIRRAVILIGSLLLFKRMVMNKKFGKFGLLILPFHFLMQIIVPWLLVICCSSLFVITALDPSTSLFLWFVLLLPTFILIIISRTFFLSFLQSQLALVIATLKLLTRRTTQFINTIPSTRQ